MPSFLTKFRLQPEFLAISLIILAVTSRWLPHPPNVAPIAAMAIFSGLVLQKRWAVGVPLIALFLSDLLLGFYGPVMLAVYGSFGLSFMIGRWASRKVSLMRLLVATLGSASLFYLITNAAVWLFGSMYPHDLVGLGQSYLAAVPFFRNSLLGDFMYLGIFISLWRLVGQTLSDTPVEKPSKFNIPSIAN